MELTGTKCALEFPRTKWLSACLIDEQALNERIGCIKAVDYLWIGYWGPCGIWLDLPTLRMSAYEQLKRKLAQDPKVWLVTGVAGFIGSNLLEALLKLDQKVVGLDNFSTGRKPNLAEVRNLVTSQQWSNFTEIEGDIQDLEICQRACRGVAYVLHQAALGSVPRSIEDPIRSNASNVTGFLNMLVAARENHVKQFVYASSSSIYGDDPDLPKKENKVGRPLSPYAVTKCVNELYAEVFSRCYEFPSIGLRYFNVFGPRQDPEGPYAAVIPKWIAALIENEPVDINGDGETTRDFCYVANVVQANLLAACSAAKGANRVFNVALNHRTTLNELFQILRKHLEPDYPRLREAKPRYQSFRPGDVRHSQADIALARKVLGYEPTHGLEDGIVAALSWYKSNL